MLDNFRSTVNFDYPMFIWILNVEEYNTFWYDIVYVEIYTKGKRMSNIYFYSSQWLWK